VPLEWVCQKDLSILQDFTIYKTNNIMKKKWAWWFWATSNGYTNRDKLKKNVK